MKRKKFVKELYLRLVLTLAIVVGISAVMPMAAEAAKKKPAVKVVSLMVENKKVNSKTITVVQGSKTKVKVVVNPAKAKKSISYGKLSKKAKKIATISKSGVVSAKKKNGTVKFTVKVKGKNGKTKSVWFKVKVVKKAVVKPPQPSKPAEPENPGTNVGSDTCDHYWQYQFTDARTICQYCHNDFENAGDHFTYEFYKNNMMETSCNRSIGCQCAVSKCTKCNAGIKLFFGHDGDNTRGYYKVYRTFEEAAAFTPYDNWTIIPNEPSNQMDVADFLRMSHHEY